MGSACSLDEPPRQKSRPPLVPNYQVKPRAELAPEDLLRAAQHGDLRLSKWVLEQHPHAHQVNTGWSPLQLCAAGGYLEQAQLLLQRRAQLQDADHSFSPLSLACLNGHASVAELLICSFAQLDGPERCGAPLLHAAYKNHADICELLLHADANPQVTSNHRGMLAPPSSISQQEHTWQSVLCAAGTAPRSADLLGLGSSALHFAAWHGSGRVAEALLARAARADARDELQRTSLMLASERGHVETVRLLLQCRAHGEVTDLHGQTPMSLAARAGRTMIVQLLLDAVHVDFVPWRGAPTALHIAAYHRHPAVAKLLLERQACVEVLLQPGGLSPLMVAAGVGCLEICQALIAHSAAVNASDSSGASAWHHGAMNGHEKVTQLLTALGAQM